MNIDYEKTKNGPVSDRGCTDIICCLVFIAFIVGLCAACGYGLTNGDPALILTGWDSDGKLADLTFKIALAATTER